MHIPSSTRERSLRKLSSLLKPNGKLVISLRHGACDDERTMYLLPVLADELAQLASRYGLTFQLLTPEQQTDELGRDDVGWQTVMLTLPDDGTGAFPLLRNIVVNDNKTSTYKVALLKPASRIAEGHPALCWIKQTTTSHSRWIGSVVLAKKLYRPLVDHYGMHKALIAVKDSALLNPGWQLLSDPQCRGFYVGAQYSDAAIVQP